MRTRAAFKGVVTVLAATLAACGGQLSSPISPSAVAATGSQPASPPWGPETPNFNLEVTLRGDNGGFGLVRFRQPNDDQLIILLDTWVRGLQPDTSYLLQRAVDTTLDGVCSSTAWLTLGKGLTPQAITTDGRGTGGEELSRSVSAFPVGSTFDIYFRVIEQATSQVVLQCGCDQFTISQ
jgi:hypothetical protein